MKLQLSRLWRALFLLTWTAASTLLVASTLAMGGDALTYGTLKFDEKDFDFGQVFRGSELTHRFKFTNTGPGPLTIQGVHAACGCTAVEVEKGRKYQPGESGQVDIRLDTTDFAGVLVKTVTVMSNETLLPDRTLTLKADIRSDVEAIPPLFDFGDVRPAALAKRTLRIRAAKGSKLTVADLAYNHDVLDVDLVRDKDDWLITAQLRPTVKPGFLKEQVSVRNTSAHLRTLPLPVRANVLGNIDLTPAYLEFGAVTVGDVEKRSVTLRSVHAFEITSSRFELFVNGAQVERPEAFLKMATSGPAAPQRQLSVELKNAGKAVGSVHGKVYVETTDSTQRELSFDFYAFFK